MKPINWIILTAFFFTNFIGPVPQSYAQSDFILPLPGAMISLSKPFVPLQLKGIQIFPKDPLRFDFLLDKGQSGLSGQALNDEVTRLTKYFLTSLTVPETDVWVNLSPYEKNRIAPENFGITQMGKDLLEQDYLLKQITASLSYPGRELGHRFWLKMYEKAYKLYGTTDVPVNSFNKVWIVPKSADVYVHGSSAFVAHSELDVMLDADYLALRQNLDNTALGLNRVRNQDIGQYAQVYTQVVREVILPVLRKEVNEGKNFAVVRQVFQAMILATWYKRHLKNSLLGKIYVGKNKVAGVDVEDKNIKEEIFQQYLSAFKKKVYNYIKEDYDPLTQETVPRKYVSGGFDGTDFGVLGDTAYKEDAAMGQVKFNNDLAMATISLSPHSEVDEIKAFNQLLASIVNGQLDFSKDVKQELALSVQSFLMKGNGDFILGRILAYRKLLELPKSNAIETKLDKFRATLTEQDLQVIADLLVIMEKKYIESEPLKAIQELELMPFQVRFTSSLHGYVNDVARRLANAQNIIEETFYKLSWSGDTWFSNNPLVKVSILDRTNETSSHQVAYNIGSHEIEIGEDARSLNQHEFNRQFQEAYRMALSHRIAKMLANRLDLDNEGQEQLQATIFQIAEKEISLTKFIFFCNMSDQLSIENVNSFLDILIRTKDISAQQLAWFMGRDKQSEVNGEIVSENQDKRTWGSRLLGFAQEHPILASIPIIAIAAFASLGAGHAADLNHPPVAPHFDQNHQPLVLSHALGLSNHGLEVTNTGSILIDHVSAGDIRHLAGQQNSVTHHAYDGDYLSKNADRIIQGARHDIQKGVFTQNVQNVVVAFEHANHLPENGRIGKPVVDQLNVMIGASTSAVGPSSGAGGGAPGGGTPPQAEMGSHAAPLPASVIQPQATAHRCKLKPQVRRV